MKGRFVISSGVVVDEKRDTYNRDITFDGSRFQKLVYHYLCEEEQGD
jgi:hypothetical protein